MTKAAKPTAHRSENSNISTTGMSCNDNIHELPKHSGPNIQFSVGIETLAMNQVEGTTMAGTLAKATATFLRNHTKNHQIISHGKPYDKNEQPSTLQEASFLCD